MHLLGCVFMDSTLKTILDSIDQSVHVVSDITTYCTLCCHTLLLIPTPFLIQAVTYWLFKHEHVAGTC